MESAYDSWIRERLSRGLLEREAVWRDSIAVGEASFVREFNKRLGIRANSREIAMADGEGSFILREGEDTYGGIYRGKNEVISKRDKFKKITNDL